MDTLSNVLQFCHGEIILDALCVLKGDFHITHDALPHKEAMFHLMLTGNCSITAACGTSYQIQQGDFLLLTQGQAHSVSHTSTPTQSTVQPIWQHTSKLLSIKSTQGASLGSDVDILCGRIRYQQNLGKALLQSLPAVLVAHLHQTPGVPALQLFTHTIRQEVALQTSGSWHIINALVQTLFVYALRSYTQQNPMQASWVLLLADARLAASVHAMLQQPEVNWSLHSLAQKANMSRATYARKFKALANTTPLNFLQNIRIMHASELLIHSKRTISDIACATGYRSEAAFSKVFKQHQGMPPSIWRRQHSNLNLATIL